MLWRRTSRRAENRAGGAESVQPRVHMQCSENKRSLKIIMHISSSQVAYIILPLSSSDPRMA